MEEFVDLHSELLKEEHQAEKHESDHMRQSMPLKEMQNRGICISKMHIISLKTGLYGRTIIKLGLRNQNPLKSNVFSSGDIVDVIKQSNDLSSKPELQGVVTSVKQSSISIALDGDEVQSKAGDLKTSDQNLNIFKTANQVTYERLKKGLNRLKHHSGRSSGVIDVCFNSSKPTKYSNTPKVERFLNSSLNDSQKEAINFALSQRQLAIIHGPPGTGKTTTIVELISQLVINGQKVLTCAPSNVAVDNILEKLSNVKVAKLSSINANPCTVKVLRIGHPARIHSTNLHRMTLDAVIARSDSAGIVRDIRKDIDDLYCKFRKKHKREENFKLRAEKKILVKELRDREKKAIKEILSSADVVLATNVGSHSDGPLKHLPPDHFDVVVIDECGQALEASCWIPMLYAPKCILAGDHLQLPPTVKSHTAAAKGLSKSLLERVTKLHNDDVVRMLNIQYRMHEKIMSWSSDNMYNSQLKAHPSVEAHLLSDLDAIDETDETISPLVFIDTAGCDMPEHQTSENDSTGNPGEAKVVASHVCSLITAGVDPKDIAVISPYNLQVEILRKLLHPEYPGLEIRSVDGFQGREKEAVVLSMVRSNDKGIVGFLSDDRRTNVAVTRARRHLALICDSQTVGKHDFLRTLIDHMHEYGEVKSAHNIVEDEESGNQIHFDPSPFLLHRKSEKEKRGKETIEEKVKLDLDVIKKKFRDILLKFKERADLDSSTTVEYEFPSTLKGNERLAIHELCEELGLGHCSTGEGNERKIIISTVLNNPGPTKQITDLFVAKSCRKDEETKPLEIAPQAIKPNKDQSYKKDPDLNSQSQKNVPQVIPPAVSQSTEIIQKTDSSLDKDHEVDSQSIIPEKNLVDNAACTLCSKQIHRENLPLHQIHCERLQAMKNKFTSGKSVTTVTSKKKAQKTKKKKNQKEISDMNDDELLDEAIRTNKLCSHSNCNQTVTLVGQTCRNCGRVYCLEHHIPEIHGCGAAAHSAARQQISRDGILFRGSGVPSKKPSVEKHAHLHRKLEGKLKDMSTNRTGEKKKK